MDKLNNSDIEFYKNELIKIIDKLELYDQRKFYILYYFALGITDGEM